MGKINNEPLKIIKTFIKSFSHSDTYDLEVQDQYRRWWLYYGASDNLSLDEVEEIEAEELRKGIINLDLYYPDENRIVPRINREERVLRVLSHSKGEYFDDRTFIDEFGACVAIVTYDGLEYIHDKVFYEYEDLKDLALKIKSKDIVNLKYWECIGVYEWDEQNVFDNEFEDISDYCEEPHEWDTKDIYNSLGGEDGERKYMHDGAWISPDGTITYDR